MPIPTSIAAAIIEWDRRGRLVDDESYVQNNAPVIARVLWDAVAALKQANAEICALVPMPFEGLPDFSLACPNEADRACLTNALLAIRAAIEMAEGLHEGDWCEEAAPISAEQIKFVESSFQKPERIFGDVTLDGTTTECCNPVDPLDLSELHAFWESVK